MKIFLLKIKRHSVDPKSGHQTNLPCESKVADLHQRTSILILDFFLQYHTASNEFSASIYSNNSAAATHDVATMSSETF